MRTRLSRRNNRRPIAGVVVVVLALLFVALRLALPDVFLRLTAPFFALGDSLASHNKSFFSSFANARDLTTKNAKLAEENSVLALENETLHQKIEDYSALVGSSTAPTGILAGVVSRPPTSPYDTLILAAGSEAGVAPSMEAYGAAGVPLGVIKSVTTHFSRLELFSSSGVATDALIGAKHVPVALIGQGAGAFTASLSQASGVAIGDLVYLAGPGTVPVGRVAHVSGAPSDPVATIAIQPLANPFTVTWVLLREAPKAASSTLIQTPGP